MAHNIMYGQNFADIIKTVFSVLFNHIVIIMTIVDNYLSTRMSVIELASITFTDL